MTEKLKEATRAPLARKPRPEKVKAVEELREILSSAKAFYLADFGKINVGGITQLRRALVGADSGLRVVKNNLLRRALAEMKIDEMARQIEGQNAILYANGDEVAPVRIFHEFSTERGVGVLKAGFLSGQILGKKDMDTLSRLPSDQELRARVVGTLYAHLSGVVYAMKALLNKTVYALSAIRENKAS